MQSHPMQTLERSNSSLLLLDSLVRVFGLVNLDEGTKPRGVSPYVVTRAGTAPAQGAFVPAPDASSIPYLAGDPMGAFAAATSGAPFVPGPAPPVAAAAVSEESIPTAAAEASALRTPLHAHPLPGGGRRGCSCQTLSLGKTWPSVQKLAPAWTSTITWPEGLPEGEFAREEARRLVWGAVMIVASRTMYTSAAPDSILCNGKLFVSEPDTVSGLRVYVVAWLASGS